MWRKNSITNNMKKLFLFPILLFPLVGCSSGESSSIDYDSASPKFVTVGYGTIEVRLKPEDIFTSYSMKVNDQIFNEFKQYTDIKIDDKLAITEFTAEPSTMEFNLYYAVTNKAGKLEVHIGKSIKLNDMNNYLDQYINPYFKYGKKFYLCIGTADVGNWTHGLDPDMDKAIEEKEASINK